MAFDGINSRFNNQVNVVNASSTQTSTQVVAGVVVTGSLIKLEAGQVEDGLTFRWTLGGTKSATNGAHKALLVVGGTTVMTLTSDGNTAVDWSAEFIMRCSGGADQKIIGRMWNLTEDSVVDYAAGTVNLRPGGNLWCNIGVANTSDTVTCELCIVEAWVK